MPLAGKLTGRALNGDGFAPKFIGQIMAAIKEEKLIDYDAQGEEEVLGIKLIRQTKNIEIGFFRSGDPPKMKVGGPVYYALDCADIIAGVNARISKLARESVPAGDMTSQNR